MPHNLSCEREARLILPPKVGPRISMKKLVSPLRGDGPYQAVEPMRWLGVLVFLKFSAWEATK